MKFILLFLFIHTRCWSFHLFSLWFEIQLCFDFDIRVHRLWIWILGVKNVSLSHINARAQSPHDTQFSTARQWVYWQVLNYVCVNTIIFVVRSNGKFIHCAKMCLYAHTNSPAVSSHARSIWNAFYGNLSLMYVTSNEWLKLTLRSWQSN